MDIIAARNLHKTYDTGKIKVHALRGLDFAIAKGDFVSIIGPSGSGKSTLMHLIGCLDVPTEGNIFIDGIDIGTLNDNALADIRNQKIGFVFQAFNLLSKETCLHNVETPLIYRGMEKKERINKATAILDRVGLSSKLFVKPLELSGGQKQRVAIARALVTNPAILLADEPTGALDTQTSYEIMHLLTELNAEGNTIILVTHEHDIAAYSRTMIKIKDGKIDEIISNGKK